MTTWRKAWSRLRTSVWRRAQDDRDLDDEIRFHLAQEARLRMEAGAAPGDAAAAARRDFGNVERVREVTRAMRTSSVFETLGQDLRFGIRLLRRSRAFAIFGTLSLALGIGAATTIFSLFDAIVLRTLPVAEPDRLVALSFAARGSRPNNFLTYPFFARLRDANTSFDGMFAWMTRRRLSAVLDGRTEIISALYASGGYHRTLGLRPAAGRLLTDDDDQPNGATSIVISHGYWQRRFAGNPSAIGTQVRLGEYTYTVVGVEPRGFTGPNVGSAPDVVLPLRASSHGSTGPQPWESTDWTWIEVVARLKAGITHDQAAHEATSLFRTIESTPTSPGAAPPLVFVEPGAHGGQSTLRRNYERQLRLMLLMLSAVVLLASLNVATLLLARAEARRDEIAMRFALGAGRLRIVRQMITEAGLVAVCGGTLGVLFAWWAGPVLLGIAVRDVSNFAIDLTPDVRVLAFALLMTACTCLLFGLFPAVRATRRVHAMSRSAVRTPHKRRLERGLVALQTAVSLVLLVFAALFVRSLQNVWARDPGYTRTNVAMFSTDAVLAGKKGEEARAVYRTILDRVRALPGVTHASVSTVAPVSTSYYFVGSVGRVGEQVLDGDRRIRVATNYLSPGYFATLGIPLVAGRDFDARDDASAPKVVIISERLASKFTGNAVGQTLGGPNADASEVVGIARDSRYANVKDAPRDVVYMPMFQHPGSAGYGPTYEIRYEGGTAAAMQAIRGVVADVDPALTIFNLNTLETYTKQSLSQDRLLAMSSTYVGGFALLLAAIGLYGLIAYAVGQRTPELGLRMALGSRPAAVRRLVLRDSAMTVIAGVVPGLGCAAWLVRYVRGQLVDLEPLDPAAFAAATLILAAVAFAAAWLPAWRASRIDPLVALRHE
jgi:predicted permease